MLAGGFVHQPCSNASSARLTEHLLQGLNRLLLHVREQVRVDVQGDADGGVSEHLGDDLGVDVLREQQRGAGMAEVVKANLWQPRVLQERLEGAVAEVRGVYDGLGLGGEDQASRLLERSQLLHLPELAGEVGLEG